MAKAIVGIHSLTAFLDEMRDFARQAEADVRLPEADYQLDFGTARELFSELTPARMALLRALREGGPMSVYALAKRAGRAYSNVHGDIARLIELELAAKDEQGRVFVPWDDVIVRVDASLMGEAA
ncbi:MAG: hypothetical protein HZB71_09400 [Betaproteobacteria bacterium]|nr:hypothetical protein [Betaproteobacteria bacterium]